MGYEGIVMRHLPWKIRYIVVIKLKDTLPNNSHTLNAHSHAWLTPTSTQSFSKVAIILISSHTHNHTPFTWLTPTCTQANLIKMHNSHYDKQAYSQTHSHCITHTYILTNHTEIHVTITLTLLALEHSSQLYELALGMPSIKV